MMRAVRFHDYNGLSGVRIDQIPTPSVDPGALLVRVHAAGVNPFDRYAVEGYVNAFVSFTLPAVLGRDFSGVVERSEEHTSELQSLMRISYAVFCLKKKKKKNHHKH